MVRKLLTFMLCVSVISVEVEVEVELEAGEDAPK